MFLIPPPSQECSFPLGLGRERLWVGILKRRYINFDWLTDWLNKNVDKYVPVSDFIESSELDVMVIVESWHHSSADVAVRRAAPPAMASTSSTVRVMINGLPLCPWLCPLLPTRPLLPSEFLVPRARLAIMQRRAFSVVGPSAWNDLPFELRFVLMAHPSKFYISLKSFFFVRGWAGSASE